LTQTGFEKVNNYLIKKKTVIYRPDICLSFFQSQASFL